MTSSVSLRALVIIALVAIPFEILGSLTRMAHKYAVQDVLGHALSRLKKYYTNDLSAWQDSNTRDRYITTRNHHAPTVVKLSRLTNTPFLLPTAFLLCTELLTSALSAGSVPVASCVSSLPIPDQLLLMSSRARLMRRCSARPRRLLAAVPCVDCTTRGLCTVARVAPLLGPRDSGVNAFLNPLALHEGDVLKPVATTLWGDMSWRMFCDNCRAELVRTDELESRCIWDDLPAIFDMRLDEDSWPTVSATET